MITGKFSKDITGDFTIEEMAGKDLLPGSTLECNGFIGGNCESLKLVMLHLVAVQVLKLF